MKKLNQILCKFLIIAPLIFSTALSSDKIVGKAKVIDGDTITINSINIRFSGIDAPESFYKGKSQICNLLSNNELVNCGKISKITLENKIKENIITCIKETVDRYNRVIAECFLNEESLSRYMVRSGYAFDYVKFSKGKFQNDQVFAKKNKLGLWNMSFKYPWIWRKMNK